MRIRNYLVQLSLVSLVFLLPIGSAQFLAAQAPEIEWEFYQHEEGPGAYDACAVAGLCEFDYVENWNNDDPPTGEAIATFTTRFLARNPVSAFVGATSTGGISRKKGLLGSDGYGELNITSISHMHYQGGYGYGNGERTYADGEVFSLWYRMVEDGFLVNSPGLGDTVIVTGNWKFPLPLESNYYELSGGGFVKAGWIGRVPSNNPGPCITIDPLVTDPCKEQCEDLCGVGGQAGFCPFPEVKSNGIHEDFTATTGLPEGCSSCGGTASVGSTLPGLSVSRRLIPSNQVSVGNSSPGMMFDFDMRLTVLADPSNSQHALLFDPCTEKTICFHDENESGTYVPELKGYFHSFTLIDTIDPSANPSTVSDPSTTETQNVYAILTRKNGWKYTMELCSVPISTDSYGGRLLKITSPSGFEVVFTYDDSGDLVSSPTRQYRIATITDAYNNSATVSYHPQQQASRWAISEIDIENGDTILEYGYNSDGHLHTVERNNEVISTYTYQSDPKWDSAQITWDQRLWDGPNANDTIFLAKDYLMWNDELVNQFANVILGRADGTGYRYMSVSRSETEVGLRRIEHRGRLVEWQVGSYFQYFKHFKVTGPGYDGYVGIKEDVFAHHPGISTNQAMQGTPPYVVDETGFTKFSHYDEFGNVTRTNFLIDGTYEAWRYDANNQEIYYQDRGGFVRETERVDGKVVRVARGLKQLSGYNPSSPPAPVALPESTQETFGYYGQGHANEGMLEWSASGEYDAGGVSAPPANERTDYAYDLNNRIIEVTKPLPAGQSIRPKITYDWNEFNKDDGRVLKVINEIAQETKFFYDELGRLERTQFPDGSNEETWYDDASEKVYKKDRNGVVSLVVYDDAGRMQTQFAAYGNDSSTILDGTVENLNAGSFRSTSSRFYLPGRTTPTSSKVDGRQTTYKFDYRGRVIETSQYSASNQIGSKQKMIYVDNMLLCTEVHSPTYVSRVYNGYSSDRQTVRKIQCRTPTVTFADNDAVMSALRIPGIEPDHVIADAVRDLRGNLVQVFDAYGTETRNEFDALGRQTKSTQAFGTPIALTTDTEFNAQGNVTQTTDPAQTVTKTEYDDAGNVKKRTVGFGATNGIPVVTEYKYDPMGRVKETTLPSGGINTNYYSDCCGNYQGSRNAEGGGRITVSNSGGQTVYTATVDDFDFENGNYLDPGNNSIEPLSETLNETTTRYRDDGRVEFRTVWSSPRGLIDPANPEIAGIDGVPSIEGVTTQYVYFNEVKPFPAPTQVVPRLGGGTATINIVAAVNKLKALPASGGANVSFGKTRNGSATVVISPDEKTMNVSIIDAMGRSVMNALMTGPAWVNDPNDDLPDGPNELITWTCTQHGQDYTLANFGEVARTNQIDQDGEVTSQLTDGFGRNVGTISQYINSSNVSVDSVTRNKFDEAGNLRESLNALGHLTVYTYDVLGRRITSTNFAGTTETSYDPSTGQVAWRKDAKNNLTQYLYDDLGREWQTMDRLHTTANPSVTIKTYDSAGRLEVITDAENHPTLYGYDDLGRRTSVTLENGQVTSTTYDKAGRVASVTKESGKKEINVYEFSGVLDKVDFVQVNGNTETLIGTNNYTYDDLLRRTGSTSFDSVTNATTYTQRGRVMSETTTYGGQSYPVTFVYDTRGRNTKVTYPSGREVEYTFTNRGELDLVKLDGTEVENRDYDEARRLTEIDRLHTDESRTYDAANRLLTIGNSNVDTATYTYDANGNKLSETWSNTLSPWSFSTEEPGASSFVDGYDAEDRFRRFKRSGQNEDILMDRSQIGNISNFKLNNVDQTRTYSNVHELETIQGFPNQVFDDDGNLELTFAGITLEWNHAGFLDKATVPSTATAGIEGVYEYGYDADKKRVWKKLNPTGEAASETVYIYAGPNCIAEYEAGTAPAAPDQEFVYGNTIDSLLAIARGTQILTVLRNQQWSVSTLMDGANVFRHYIYDVFGKRTAIDSSGSAILDNGEPTFDALDSSFGYTSRRHDDETGLMYFRARYYDNQSGEFVSSDRLEYVDGMSQYRGYFVLAGKDPSGSNVFFQVVSVGDGLVDQTKPAGNLWHYQAFRVFDLLTHSNIPDKLAKKDADKLAEEHGFDVEKHALTIVWLQHVQLDKICCNEIRCRHESFDFWEWWSREDNSNYRKDKSNIIQEDGYNRTRWAKDTHGFEEVACDCEVKIRVSSTIGIALDRKPPRFYGIPNEGVGAPTDTVPDLLKKDIGGSAYIWKDAYHSWGHTIECQQGACHQGPEYGIKN